MKKLSYKIIAFVMVIAVVFGSVTAYGWEYKCYGLNYARITAECDKKIADDVDTLKFYVEMKWIKSYQ